LRHQDYPFALLVERLQPERDAGYSPLFNVACVLQNSHLIDRSLAALAIGEAGTQIDLNGARLAVGITDGARPPLLARRQAIVPAVDRYTSKTY
jgi:hypothetical protein